MFIERIDVERFGALSRVTIDGLGPGVQVLHGTNETGKTTLLEFVRAVFFGFEGLFRRGVLDPRRPCAGRLLVRTGPERSLVSLERRHEGPHLASLTRAAYEDDIVGLGGDEGDLMEIALVDPSGATHGHRVYLQDLVGGIDETTFTSVMAFGLDELHELRTLEPEGCGSRLYELASGLDRSKVARVLAHLKDAVARLDADDPTVSPIRALEARGRDLVGRIAAAGSPALAAGGLWAELARLDAEIAGLEGRVATALKDEAAVRAALPLEEFHDLWRLAADRLAELEATPLVHPDRDAWRSARRRLARFERIATRRRRRRTKLARASAALPVETEVWRKRAAVAALLEEQPRLERLVADVSRVEAHARLAARRFGEQVGVAGLSRLIPVAGMLATATDADAIPDVLLPEGFAHSFGPLKARARGIARASRDVAAARAAVAEARRGLDDARGSLRGVGTTGGATIGEAIEAAAGRVAGLRRRITAGERLAELDRTLARLDRDVAGLTGQLVPVPWLVGLGSVFAIGAALLLSGLLLPAEVTGSAGYALAALGLAGTGLASVTTWSLDRGGSQRLEVARRQRDMARRQREEALAQCGSLDATLGADATSLERRLAAAQAEVDRLEELATREGSLNLLADRVAVAEQGLARARAARGEAQRRWRRALEHRGLPPTLTPREVRQIAAHRHALLALEDDRHRLSEEARVKRAEVAAAARRIDELLVACGLAPEAGPLDHLRLLQERLDAEKAAVRRRAALARRLEVARRRHRHAKRQVRVAERGVREFYVRWSVATEQEFLAKVDRRPEHEEARREAEMAETAWTDARRRAADAAVIDRWLAERPAVTFERRLADAVEATTRQRRELAAVRERRGAVSARVEAAARDHAPESLQAELAEVEERLGEQLERRRLLEHARVLLEDTRAAVARDHQPPVLREASRWLARLTAGRYGSITTAIDEARLEVHESDGTVWNPERLSRGTREQVFLALRLALIRDLGRHDVSLPIVMDDALVNFDDARATLAARVLVEFVAEQGAGRQMLVLTCHRHVAEMFHTAGGVVRSLGGELPPGTDLVVAAPAPAAPKPRRRSPRKTPNPDPPPAA
jgi:uncharacterized protein YhaN